MRMAGLARATLSLRRRETSFRQVLRSVEEQPDTPMELSFSAFATIAAAFEDTRATGERWWEAELHRIRGELLASSDATEATHCFRTAIEIARRQGAKSLELKAVASLSALRPRRTRSF